MLYQLSYASPIAYRRKQSGRAPKQKLDRHTKALPTDHGTEVKISTGGTVGQPWGGGKCLSLHWYRCIQGV